MNKWLLGLLLACMAPPNLAQGTPEGTVQIINCDGRQILVVVVPLGREDAVPPNLCALTEQKPVYQNQEGYPREREYYQEQPETRPLSSWICAGGTCFPRRFILTPAHPPAKKPTPPTGK